MTIRRFEIGRQRARWALLGLAGALAAMPALAQENPPQPEFTPTLFVVGAYSSDELRTGGDPASGSSLFTEAELPFTFSGPRWQGGLSLNPSYRKFRGDSSLDSFDTSFNGWLSGRMSARTVLRARVGVVHSPDLTVLDVADVLSPRADRVRSRGEVTVAHRLNGAGDSITGGIRFTGLNYLDDTFQNQQSYGVQVGYGKALGPRSSVSVSGAADRVSQEDGSRVNAYTPLIGFGYRLGPKTDLDFGGGISFLDGEVVRDTGPVQVGGRTIAIRGGLRHSELAWAVSVAAERGIASGVALGEPTIRSQLSATVGHSGHRLRVGLSGGFSINELFGDGDGTVVLLSPSGLLETGSDRVSTLSSCVDFGYRLTRWASLVGAGSFATQRASGAPQSLELDLYRFSLGVAVHPYAGRIATARGEQVLARYGRAGIVGSC